MPISLVDVGVGNTAINGGDVTVTLPVVMQENDFVLAFGGHGRFAGVVPSISTAGYSNSANWGSATAPGRIGVYASKFMGASPDVDFLGVGSADAQDAVGFTALVFRGVDLSNPFDVTPTTTNGGTSGVPNSPSITTVTPGCAIISLGLSRAFDSVVTPPTGYGDTICVSADDTTDVSVMMAWITQGSAGTEDPGPWSGITATGWLAGTVALRPAADSGTTRWLWNA